MRIKIPALLAEVIVGVGIGVLGVLGGVVIAGIVIAACGWWGV